MRAPPRSGRQRAYHDSDERQRSSVDRVQASDRLAPPDAKEDAVATYSLSVFMEPTTRNEEGDYEP